MKQNYYIRQSFPRFYFRLSQFHFLVKNYG